MSNLAELSDADLAAEKAALEAERIEARDRLKEAADPITAEQFRRARETTIVYHLRNNLKPRGLNLDYLAGLDAGQIAELERRAVETAKAAKAKNPAWHPHAPERNWSLAELVAGHKRARRT